MEISLKTLEAFLQQKNKLIKPALEYEEDLQKHTRREIGIAKEKEIAKEQKLLLQKQKLL